MYRLPPRRLVCTLVAVLVSSILAVAAPTAHAGQPPGYGPSDPFDDAKLANDGKGVSVRGKALIQRTRYGYRFIAAEQNTHLTISWTNDRLRFRDRRTPSWQSLPKSCTRKRVSTGIAATCRVREGAANSTLLEVHPRLGNDFVDGRGLPARFDMAVLGDAGRDTLFGGRGNDYFTGAMARDLINAGPGKDWIRGGEGHDRIRGGAGRDWIVGMSGRDRISGGSGLDRIFQ